MRPLVFPFSDCEPFLAHEAQAAKVADQPILRVLCARIGDFPRGGAIYRPEDDNIGPDIPYAPQLTGQNIQRGGPYLAYPLPRARRRRFCGAG